MDNEISYSVFMIGMRNAPWDSDKCARCGGTGLKPVYCCSGFECGCRGLPVNFEPCECGTKAPTNDQIKAWAVSRLTPVAADAEAAPLNSDS